MTHRDQFFSEIGDDPFSPAVQPGGTDSASGATCAIFNLQNPFEIPSGPTQKGSVGLRNLIRD